MMLNRSDGESLDLKVFQVHQLMPYSVILKRTLRHICVISFFDGTPMTSLYRRQVCFWELLLVLLTFHYSSTHLSVLAAFKWLLFSSPDLIVSVVQTVL